MAGMAEGVIPGVPRSVEPLTRRLRSVHADYIYVSIALSQASLLPSTLSMSCSADYDHRNTISPFVFMRNMRLLLRPARLYPPEREGEGRMSTMRNVLHWEE